MYVVRGFSALHPKKRESPGLVECPSLHRQELRASERTGEVSVSRSDCTKSLVTVRSHSTVPAALALSLRAPAGPSRSAGARRSGPIYSDRPARSARSKLRVRRAATGVGRRWRRTRAHNPPRHLFVRPWRYPPRGSQSHASRTRRASRSTPSTSAGIARTACTATAISASRMVSLRTPSATRTRGAHALLSM